QADLLEVVRALSPAGCLAGRLHGRQQQGDEDGNDGNDDQELDQGETRTYRLSSHGLAPRDTTRSMGETRVGEQPGPRAGMPTVREPRLPPYPVIAQDRESQ